MKQKMIILLLLITCYVHGQSVVLAGEENGKYLLVQGNTVRNEQGVIYVLQDGEQAFLSPAGKCYAILTVNGNSSSMSSRIEVFRRNHEQLYVREYRYTGWLYVADNGACVTVTPQGPEINASIRIGVFTPDGNQTAGFFIDAPADCRFFPDNRFFALSVLGDAVHVYHIASGQRYYTVPYARAFQPLGMDADLLFLVDRNWMALYDRGQPAWHRQHSLYYPRLVEGNLQENKVVIGCHHEVALVSILEGDIINVWTTPPDFGVTDLDVASDSSFCVVGLRSLDGVEAAFLLDGYLSPVNETGANVARPSRSMPAVLALMQQGNTKAALVFGQGWNDTLVW